MFLEHLPGAVIDIKKIGEQIYPSMKYKNLNYKSEVQKEDQLTWKYKKEKKKVDFERKKGSSKKEAVACTPGSTVATSHC